MRLLPLTALSLTLAIAGAAGGHAATAAARRYPSIRYWMIIGEPSNVSVHFAPFPDAPSGRHLTPSQAAAPRLYARILDAAYGALKAVNRANIVIGGNTFTAGQPGSIATSRVLPNTRLPH